MQTKKVITIVKEIYEKHNEKIQILKYNNEFYIETFKFQHITSLARNEHKELILNSRNFTPLETLKKMISSQSRLLSMQSQKSRDVCAILMRLDAKSDVHKIVVYDDEWFSAKKSKTEYVEFEDIDFSCKKLKEVWPKIYEGHKLELHAKIKEIVEEALRK